MDLNKQHITFKMAKGGLFLVLTLTLSMSRGFVLKTTPVKSQAMYRDGDFSVVSPFSYDIANEIRGHVLEKVRTTLEVAPEYMKSSNSTLALYITCPKYDSEVFNFSPLTLVKRYQKTTELYLEFSIRDARCTECVREGDLNVTVSLLKEDINSKTVTDRKPFSVKTLEANFEDTVCDYNTSSCIAWSTNGTLVRSDSCKLRWCKDLPKAKNNPSYMAAIEETRTHWWSRDIYGSGSSCSLNFLMAAFDTTYITVSISSSKGVTPLMREKHNFGKMNWTVIAVPIGRVDETFKLSVCIHTLYIAAIQKIWMENCTAAAIEDSYCNASEFRCSTGRCIPNDWVCDLNPDCPLHDDEDKEFCDRSNYKHSCDVDSNQCSWEQNSSCLLLRADVRAYNKDLVKYRKYCAHVQTDFALIGRWCSDGSPTRLASPELQPFNASGDCRVRFWYSAEYSDEINVLVCFNESDCEVIKTLYHSSSEVEWQRTSLQLPHRYQPYQVVLQGQVYSEEGIVALDQISLTPDCFTKSDVWKHPHMEEVSTRVELEGNSGYVLTILGIGAGIVVAVVTAVVVFSAFKRRQNCKTDEGLRNILPVSTSTTSSGSDGKCSFPVDISDASLAEIERQSLVPSNMAVSSISPYYEWTEEKIRDIPRKKIKLVRLLGKGAFGEVYYGLLADATRVRTDLPIAVKKLPTLCAEQTKTELFFEAVTLSKFNHPNIVRFLGISTDDHDNSMYLLLELMEGGELRAFVRESRPKQPRELSYLTLHDLLKLGIDVAQGCQYLEQNKFIHRDIAARNCLLTEKGPNRVAKIGDFGMARDVLRTNYYRKNGRAMVPVKWMPPESFLDGIFTSKTDVWAFGVVLWELFTMGHVPYPGKSNGEVMKYVKGGRRLDKPPLCPHQIFDLMMRCWQVNAEFRPNFSAIVEELEKIHNGGELSSLITYEDIMDIEPHVFDKDHVTSGSVTYVTDIKLLAADTDMSDKDLSNV